MPSSLRRLALRVIVPIVVLDGVTKIAAVLTLPFQKTLALWPGVLELFRTVNPGVGSLAQRYLAATHMALPQLDAVAFFLPWLWVPALLWVHQRYPVERGVLPRVGAYFGSLVVAVMICMLAAEIAPVQNPSPYLARLARFVTGGATPLFAFLTVRRRGSMVIVALVLACGLGNGLNALCYPAGVVDFLWLRFLPRGWIGICNVADLAYDAALLSSIFYLPYRLFTGTKPRHEAAVLAPDAARDRAA